ncbi:MAG: hypothetical protein IKX91_06170, partial [Firmicutes bacterium]|nr:hypothetical protein [Bacillota bacterium]
RSRHLLRAYENAGWIAVGGNADFAVLSRSPFGETEETSEDPRKIPVLYTVLAGRIVSTDPADYEFLSFDEFGEEPEEED